MKISTKFTNPIQRRTFLSLLVVSILFVTCKKTTIINNYITNPTTYGTGLVQTPASTYAGIPVATIPTGTLQPSFFLQVPSVPFDQGATQGSCASSASAMAKSILDHTKNNTPYPNDKIIYSPAFLYNQVKLHPSDCSKGSTIWDNLNKIKVQGICKEIDMPYNLTNCTTQPTTAQITLAFSNKIDNYETVPLNRTAIKQTINAGFPVVVAFFVDNKFYGDYWNSSNMNTVWSTFGTPITDNLGNKSAHATVLYGWDDSKSAFRLLNSWGNGWGNTGSIWVDYSLVENNTVFLEAYKLVNSTSTTTNNLTVTGDLNFGNTTINTNSTKTIQLVNNSTTSINVTSVSITSPFSTNWSSGSIQAGASQAITITFNPTTVGNASSTLTINSNAANSPTTISANGVGIQQTTQTKIISLSGNLSYGNVIVGQTSSKTLTISNTGNSPLIVSSISTPQGFSGSYNGTIQAGNSANVTIFFSPTNVQAYSGNITVNSDATSGTNSISASGSGTQQTTQTRIISLSGNLSFGNITVGQSSNKTLTISNNGNSPLAVSSISTPQGFSGSYSGTIQAGNSANVTITFSPSNVQAYSGNITVNSDATSGTNTINTSGNGITSGPTSVPAIGTYSTCVAVGSFNCPPSFGLGTIKARIVSINTSTNQIVVEVKKCDGSAFNAGGNMNVVNLLCGGSGAVSYGFGSFSAGASTIQLTITDNNMVGSKAYVPFIVQGASLNIYYSAPALVVNY